MRFLITDGAVRFLADTIDLNLFQALTTRGGGVGFVKSKIGQSWFFGSTESSTSYDADHVDEKHYFLIPYHCSDDEYSFQAVTNTYNDFIDSPTSWSNANLGPEDISFLKGVRELARK